MPIGNRKDILLSLLGPQTLLGEDSDQELPLFVGCKGGGNDDVGARREPEPHGHLPQVDEVFGSSDGLVISEEIRV